MTNIYDDDDQVDWLIKEIDDEETALRMVNTAFRIAIALDYPFPVVTEGKHGKVGVRATSWDEPSAGTFMVGYGISTGSIE